MSCMNMACGVKDIDTGIPDMARRHLYVLYLPLCSAQHRLNGCLRGCAVYQDENYDLLAQENPEAEGANENGEQAGYDNINGTLQDAEMTNGEAAPDPGEASTTTGAGLTGERQPNKVRVTTPYLTKYERARVLGTRALQIRCAREKYVHVLHMFTFL